MLEWALGRGPLLGFLLPLLFVGVWLATWGVLRWRGRARASPPAEPAPAYRASARPAPSPVREDREVERRIRATITALALTLVPPLLLSLGLVSAHGITGPVAFLALLSPLRDRGLERLAVVDPTDRHAREVRALALSELGRCSEAEHELGLGHTRMDLAVSGFGCWEWGFASCPDCTMMGHAPPHLPVPPPPRRWQERVIVALQEAAYRRGLITTIGRLRAYERLSPPD